MVSLYNYQRKILEAAGVEINTDSEEVLQKKVSVQWTLVESKMIDNNLAFDVKEGSLLKKGRVTKFDGLV